MYGVEVRFKFETSQKRHSAAVFSCALYIVLFDQ